MKKLTVLLFMLALIVQPFSAKGQDVESYLKNLLTNNYGEEYVKGYMQPFSTALGTALGGAMYHRGYSKTFPRFDVGISAVYIPLPDEAMTFSSPVPGQGTVPTVFGEEHPNDTLVVGGINSNKFALPVLQANIGLLANLEATARFITTDIDNIGQLTVYGGALKYELSGLIPIPLFPIDFGVQAGYHKFTLGDYLDAGTFSMNFQASASIPVMPVDIYGGIGYDNSQLTIDTGKLLPGSTLGDVKVDGENNLRYNVGVSLTFLVINAHVDYTIGKYNSVAMGLMFVL